MPAPCWLARFNLHVTNPLLGPRARHLPGMGVVLHIGRKTGRQYRTPVLVFRRGNRLIIALAYGRDSQWVRNVLAEDGCQLETASRRLQLSHPRLVHDEHGGAMPAFVRFVLSLLNVSDFLEFTIAENAASE